MFSKLPMLFQSLWMGARIEWKISKIRNQVCQYILGHEHDLEVLAHSSDRYRPDTEDLRYNHWLTICDEDLMIHGLRMPSDLPNTMIVVVTPLIGCFIVNKAYCRSSDALQQAILEHELGHLKEGHLSEGSPSSGSFIRKLDMELTADTYVQNVPVFIELLDRYLAHPDLDKSHSTKEIMLRRDVLLYRI